MLTWWHQAKPWKPWAYQERALKFLLEHGQAGLLLEPGLGKTSISLAAVKILLGKKLMRRVLVVAPLRAIYDVWPAEISDWEDFHNFNIAILHGGNKDKVLRQLEPHHQLALINFEGLPWLMTDKARMKQLDADVLIIDESSKMKASNTLRFRVLRPHLQEFKRRYILTGSPRPKNYLDLFAQIYLLDRGAALGAYITHYKNTFFYPTGYDMREWALLPGADKKINALVAPMVLRLDAKDYLKLPKEMERVHRVELPPKARAEYDQIEKNFVSTLFNAPMVNSAAARSKCCQIANGGVYLDPTPQDDRWPARDRPVRFIHTAKVDALVELYEELQGEQLMVAIGYHHDVTAIRAALNRDVPCINGQTTKNQASDYIDRWNSGELDLLLVHPASAGHALNLQKFSPRHVAFFYIPDDYDHFDQCWRRVWRQGNKAEWVMRHLFIADNTVDVPKLANLRRKGDGQNDFLRAMKVYAEKRYGKL
jgi:SNF2 family DNA or RNA helicase